MMIQLLAIMTIASSAVFGSPFDKIVVRKRSAECPNAQLAEIKELVFTQAQKDAMVKAHNDARSATSKEQKATNMGVMEWDEELERMAQYTANTCVYGHANMIGCDGVKIGQNAYKTSNEGSTDYTDALVKWDAEKEWYTHSDDKCTPPKPEEGQSCGHYTQVVWATSTKIGCGYKACKDQGLIVVCNYSPAGNVKGNPPFRKGNLCSECVTTNGSKCKNGLCANCLPKEDSKCKCNKDCNEDKNQGSLDQPTCTCKCNTDFYGTSCEGSCNDLPGRAAGCSSWKKSGYCETTSKYYQFVKDNCYETCGHKAKNPDC